MVPMKEITMNTQFASPERAPRADILRLRDSVEAGGIIPRLLNATGQMMAVLNSHRQIVYCNRAFLDAVGAKEMSVVLGLRTGEAFDCVRAGENKSGCGTTPGCATCGALRATLQAQRGAADMEECRIRSRVVGSDLDLRVWATPFPRGDEELVIFAAQDISHEKRCRTLRRARRRNSFRSSGRSQEN
jgi:PAS domain-containing protein